MKRTLFYLSRLVISSYCFCCLFLAEQWQTLYNTKKGSLYHFLLTFCQSGMPQAVLFLVDFRNLVLKSNLFLYGMVFKSTNEIITYTWRRQSGFPDVRQCDFRSSRNT